MFNDEENEPRKEMARQAVFEYIRKFPEYDHYSDETLKVLIEEITTNYDEELRSGN